MHARWHIQLLGGLRAEHGGRVITRFRSQKTGALLGYLAFFSHRAHPREELIELLWPDCDPVVARSRLSVALSSLRHQFEPPGVSAGAVLISHRTFVRLNPEAVTTDVSEFEVALQAAERSRTSTEREQWLVQAVERYQGPLLPGYYEEWILPEQERLAERYGQALRSLTVHAANAGDLHRALDYAHRAIAADPFREEAHQELMRLHAAAGQPSAAMRRYRELEKLLAEELGQTPSAATRALAKEIEASGVQAGSTRFAPGPGPTFRAPARSDVQEDESPFAPNARTPERLNAEHLPSLGKLPSLNAGPAPSGELPLQFTRFFGREPELAHLREWLLSDGIRLVTLTGPGGTGKTRLALQAAAQLVEALAGAVWFVPLADLFDPERIPDAILNTLRLPRSPHLSPREQVMRALSGQPVLLVLDNFEHLVTEGAPLVRALLEEVPTLKSLITSRRQLGLEGEREFHVLPMPTPLSGVQAFGRSGIQDTEGVRDVVDVQQESSLPGLNARTPERLNAASAARPEHLLRFPSVQLFVDRAQAVRPDFQITTRNAAAVAELCHRLDGIPLALELAAARAQVLTPAQMLAQLEHRFDFLVSRRRGAVPRHRTLRATMEWGHRLLEPELQRFFTQLSVFRGGWTLDAAEAVCSGVQAFRRSGVQAGSDSQHLNTSIPQHPTPQPLNARTPERLNALLPDVLDSLAQLRECSMVIVEEGAAEMRFRILETLREYAAEQLAPAERAVLGRWHAEYFLTLAEELGAALEGAEERSLRVRLEAELDNFRAALDWALESEPLLALRLAVALSPFWYAGSYLAEGRAALRRVLERSTEAPAALRAQALRWSGELARWQGDLYPARRWLEESLHLNRELGDRRDIAMVLDALGELGTLQRQDLQRSRQFVEESLSIWQEFGDERRIAGALRTLGILTEIHQGDTATARTLLQESLEKYRRIGDKRGIERGLRLLGIVAQNPAAARMLLEESLKIAHEIEDEALPRFALVHLAHVACQEARYAEACVLLKESLQISRRLGDKRIILECLQRFIDVFASEGDLVRAARLLGAASALSEASGVFAARWGWLDGSIAQLRERLDEAAFTAAWEAGRGLTWDEAAEEALAGAAQVG